MKPGTGPLAAVPPGGGDRYRGVTWNLYLMEDAVQTHKVLVERHDPAPVRVAPDAGGRKRRCDTFVLEGGPPDTVVT